jgi:PAS domain S-box-containing protein
MDTSIDNTPFDQPVLRNKWLELAREAGKMGAWFWELQSGKLSIDHTQAVLTGLHTTEGVVPVEAFFDIIHSEDALALQEAVDASLAEKKPFTDEFRIIKNGEVIWLGARGDVVCDAAGNITHMTGVNWDISDVKQREEQAALTAKEMAHRVKNVIALVHGIARMSARNHETLESFLPSFLERTSAIATVNNLVLASENRTASLTNIVDDTLHAVNTGGRIDIKVDDFVVNAAAAQTLVLVLNELATNAVKYGALEHDDGSIALTILVDTDADTFKLNWMETRAQPIRENTGIKGFGTQVLTSLTKATYKGEPKFEWLENGMKYSCLWTASEMSILNEG